MSRRNWGFKSVSIFLLFSLTILLITLVVIIFSTILILTFIRTQNTNEIEEKKVTSKYQAIQINIETNERSFGFASSFENLGEEEFLSYEDSTSEERIVISNFGSEEYKCIGNCYCNDNINSKLSQRRYFGSSSTPTTSNIVSKGIVYLVAAMTSIIAYDQAEKYLNRECLNLYSETCTSESSIQYEVETCDSISSPNLKNIDNLDPQDSDDDDYDNRNIKNFFCVGNCLKSGHLRTEQSLQMAEEFDCGLLEREGKISVDCTDLGTNCNTYARITFQKRYLTTYCRESSAVQFWYHFPSHSEKKKKRHRKTIHLCVGSGSHNNPTAVCRNIGFMDAYI